MNIINSAIVGSGYDVFWQDASSTTGDMAPRPLLVITNRTETDSMQEAKLQKMLSACELLPEQYNIIRLGDGEQVAWHQLHHKLNPYVVFLIGILPSSLGVSALFMINRPNHYNDTIWLPTLPIEQLEQREDVKKDLWTHGMKPLLLDKTHGELVCPSANFT